MPPQFLIFQFIVLIFSVMIHEISHGLMAERLGDPTARLAGRITLNPLKHIDMFGSILLPLLLVISGSPIIFGWAKPVPYNPALPDPRKAAGKIAAAGPLSNFLLAGVFALIFRAYVASAGLTDFAVLLTMIIIVNLSLGVFNLVPIPPLDGSKVLFSFLPRSHNAHALENFLERWGMLLILAFLYFGGNILSPIIGSLFALLTGHRLF